MEKQMIKPLRRETALTGYMPLPRGVLQFKLSSTAILLYAVLLDRGTLSQKHGYSDETGQVYVVYPIEYLAETLGRSTSSVKNCLRELTRAGLIQVCQPVKNRPNHIFLNIPEGSFLPPEMLENNPLRGRKTHSSGGQKLSPNNRIQQHDLSNFYQHGEEESL